MPSSSSAIETVKFNVGGRHFEVSRALIDEHSETVLGKLVSDTWSSDPGKTIFIDRDGDIFAQVLNQLRYGSVELPITLPRSMFDRELDYYGIKPAQACVADHGSLANLIRSFTAPVVEAEKKLVNAKIERDLFFLAYECHCQFYQYMRQDQNAAFVTILIPSGHKLYNANVLTY